MKETYNTIDWVSYFERHFNSYMSYADSHNIRDGEENIYNLDMAASTLRSVIIERINVIIKKHCS